MRYVPAPALEVIRVTDPREDPVFNGVDSNGHPKPATQSYQDWLLARTTDVVFAEHGGKKEGIDLYELLQLARRQIKATKGVTGYHVFDEEVCNRLQQAILRPTGGVIGDRAFTHNWIDWVLLWKTTYAELPGVLAPKTETLPTASVS